MQRDVTQAPSWSKLHEQARTLSANMPNDKFVATLLAGALMVGGSKNPIRGNLCASALREVVGHLLHTLASDQKVMKCGWYRSEAAENRPTRAQRAKYIVQGGLPDVFVSDTLGLKIERVGRPLIRVMERLNRSTHVRANTILTDDVEIRTIVHDCLTGVLDLLKVALSCQQKVHAQMEAQVSNAVFDVFISETIQELDELSTHTRFEEQVIDTISVADVDNELITYLVSGTLYVELVYGSSSDFRRGDGATMNGSYPYRATLSANVAKPTDVVPGSVKVTVDNSSFLA